MESLWHGLPRVSPVWYEFGAVQAMYTLYEPLGAAVLKTPAVRITFAGNWPTNARPVMEKVDQGFVVFYLLPLGLLDP